MKKTTPSQDGMVMHRLRTKQQGGGGKTTKNNAVRLPVNFHQNIRFLFGNLTPRQTERFIEEVWMNGHRSVDRILFLKIRMEIEGLDSADSYSKLRSIQKKGEKYRFRLVKHGNNGKTLMLPSAYHEAWRKTFGYLDAPEAVLLLGKIFKSRKKTWTWPQIRQLKAEIQANVFQGRK